MPSAQDLLNQYSGNPEAVHGVTNNPFTPDATAPVQAAPVVPVAPTKQQTVGSVADVKAASLAQTADAKKVDLATANGIPSLDQLYSSQLAGNSGVGNKTLPDQMQADLITMSPYSLAQKYGQDTAEQMLGGKLQAQGSIQTDLNKSRSISQVLGDAASGIGMGAANAVGGIAALGAGIVSPTAGTAIASGVKTLNDSVQNGMQSDALNAHRHLNAAANALGYRDNAAEADATEAKDGSLLSDFRRVGKDALTAVGNAATDPTIASDGVAQGIGSLVTAGPTGKLIGAGAKALVALAPELGVAPSLIAQAANSKVGRFIAHEGETMAAIGAQEAGGAYQQNAADAMDQSFIDLAKNSPMFNDLVKGGMSQDQARTTVANRSGLIAAAIQAPIATATGALVSKFEANPFALKTLRTMSQNVLKEGAEETIQSGTGQLSQNVATSKTSNENQDLLQGVGEQAGLGGLYGMASAGVVAGPGAIMSSATRGALNIGKVAAKVAQPVIDLAAKRGDRIAAENENASTVSDDKVGAAATEAVQITPAAAQQATDAINADEKLTSEEKDKANSYVEQAKGVVQFDPAEAASMPPIVQKAAEGQNSRIHFMQNLAAEAKDPKNSAADRQIAFTTLSNYIDGIDGMLKAVPGQFEGLEDDHPAKVFNDQVNGIIGSFKQSPAGKTVDVDLPSAKKVADNLATSVAATPLTEAHFDTPEGQNLAQAKIAVATSQPQKSNVADNELVMKMASAGKINVSGPQMAALKAAQVLLQGRQQYIDQLKQTGISSTKDFVAEKISTNKGSEVGRESALEHAQAVRTLYGRGDLDGATAALNGFGKFAQSQLNKIGAVNTQFATHGRDSNEQNSLHYDAALPDKSGFVKSKEPLGVKPVNPGSVKFVQEVSAEATALTGIHNALATAFPELKVKHLENVSLDPSLANGTPQQVAKEFRDGTRGVKPAAPEPVKEVVKPESSTEVVKPEETKQAVTSEESKTKDVVKETVKAVDAGAKEEKAPLNVWYGSNENAQFSNLADRPFTFEGHDYRSVEHAYQTLKSGNFDEGLHPVYALNKPGTKVAGRKGTKTEGNWNVNLMNDLVRESFAQNPKAAQALLDTGDAKFAHTQDRGIWKTEFPNALEAARSSLAQDGVPKVKPAEVVPKTVGDVHTTGLAAAFPDLIEPKSGNKFVEAFRFSKSQRSTIAGEINPLEKVQRILGSESEFQAQTNSGNKALPADIRKGYRAILAEVPGLVATINQHLSDFIKNKVKPSDKKADANRWINGKLLNLAERQEDGSYKMNQPLMESAALAGMQWLLSIGNTHSHADAESAAGLIGVDQFDPRAEQAATLMNTGTLRIDAYSALTNKIATYWGVSPIGSTDVAYTEGILSAMASEILRTLKEGGYIDEVIHQLGDKTVAIINPTTSKNLKDEKGRPMALLDEWGVRKLPDAIERAVSTKPDLNHYFDGERPEPPKSQLRNSSVPLSKEQSKMVGNETDVGHKPDMDMIQFFNALDFDGMAKVFANGTLDEESMNVNDFTSKKGKELSITSALAVVQNTMSELTQHALENGKNPEDVEAHYPHDVIKTGRLQMRGAYNPQASKVTRHAFLPTESTLDFGIQRHMEAFMLGVGQALGVKVHNMSYADMKTQLDDRIANKFAPALDVMSRFLDKPSFETEDIQKLADTLGGSVVAAFALKEYARFQRATAAEKSAFKTKLYLEADGMTNGVLMAMMMFGRDTMSADTVKHLAMGGVYFGADPMDANGKPTLTSTVQRGATGGMDMYTATADGLKKQLAEQLKTGYYPAAVKQQLQHVLLALGQLLPDAIKYTGGDDVNVGRDASKNPLMQMMYAAGSKSVASGVTGQMLAKIYEQYSEAMQNDWDKKNPYGPDRKTQNDILNNALTALTSKVARQNEKKEFYLAPTLLGGKEVSLGQHIKDTTFTKEEFEAIADNLNMLFMKPMEQVIHNVVGPEVFTAMKMVRKATQSQSIVQMHMYNDAVKAALAAKKESDPNHKEGEFLSRDELNDIQQSLRDVSPLIQAPGQTFYFPGSGRTDVGPTSFATSLDGNTFRAPSLLNGPADIGVAAVASLNQGMGDGKMIQNASNMPGAVQGRLMIYDGVHLPLDQIDVGSHQLNQAAKEAMMGNPLRAVSESFKTFMQNVPTNFAAESPLHLDLIKALIGQYALSPKNRVETLAGNPPEEIINSLRNVGLQLEQGANAVDARHRAMERVSMSYDQMASASAPFQQAGKESIGGTNEEIATRISQLTREEADAMREEPANKQESIRKELLAVGTKTASGANLINAVELSKLSYALDSKMPADQQVLVKQSLEQLAKDGYIVIHGTRSQLAAYNTSLGNRGIDAGQISNPDNHGFTMPGRHEIWLISPSSEALAHEIIHAATLRTVQAYYNGELNEHQGPVDTAIRNIEGLMNQFLDMEDQVGGLSNEMQQSFANAKAAIQAHLGNAELTEADRKAQALNEYMAWGLANQQLATLQKRTDAHPLVQMAQSVVSFIRDLVWSALGKTAPKSPGTDMFSNLMFNTQVLLHSQPSVGQVLSDAPMYMAASYGTSQRLADITDSFNQRISQYVNISGEENMKASSTRHTEASIGASQLGAKMAVHFAGVFHMTMQEQTTFSSIVAGLATEARFSPNALSRMQEIWSQVSKTLHPDMFLDPSMKGQEGTALYDREYGKAHAKYDAVIGHDFVDLDQHGRSTLLSNFIALGMTNDEFRNAIDQPLIKGKRSTAESRVDSGLENLANDMLDSLSRRVSGEGNSQDVVRSIDALANRLLEIGQDRQSFLSQHVNGFNDYTVKAMNNLTSSAVEKVTALDKKFSNKATNALKSTTKVFAAIVNEKEAGHVAEGILTYINNVKGFQTFKEIIGDMVGRVGSNEQVYDMIKTVRSMIQAVRQQFREQVPIVLGSKFSRTLTGDEQTTMHRGMGKADLASLAQGMQQSEILKLLSDPATHAAKKAELEAALKASNPKEFATYQKKMQQLANYMMGGAPGASLLKNATAIAHLLGEKLKKPASFAKGTIDNIDMLTTLYALDKLSNGERDSLATLAKEESAGMQFTLSYLQGQRTEETNRAVESDAALFNHQKGFIPSVQQAGTSLIVADDSEHGKLVGQSFQRLGAYVGSNAELNATKKSYYFLPVSGKNIFNQGTLQNIRQSAGNVDVATGYMLGQTAGRITDPKAVAAAVRVIQAGREKAATEHLMPVYDETGNVRAFERPLDPVMMERLDFNTNLHQMIGVWRGRQVEEAQAAIYNDVLIEKLHDMYQYDMSQGPSNKSRYVDLFGSQVDPVIRDAVKLITPQMREQIEATFGKQFFVRKDMLNDVLGYRSASVGDAWTGNSRFSDATQNNMKRLAMSIFGNKAYEYTVNAEKFWQGAVSDAKTMIVVKSIVVPVGNIIANGYQLISRGVPARTVFTEMPKKTAEVRAYVKSEVRRIAADAELRAAEGKKDVVAMTKLRTEIQSINDGQKRLSIYPLIQAGEFSAISDGKATAEEVELTSGRLQGYFERLVNKLPPTVRTAGRYAVITQDTALFKGMQTAMEYGDFLAKAVLYDHLMKRGQTKEQALGHITEEFVNYDRLPGRVRGYAESMGLVWFYNFKIRSAKIALSMIRNNPVHALLAGLAPTPPFFGSIGSPMTDNIMYQAATGSMHYGLGLGQLIHAPMMDPWANILSQ